MNPISANQSGRCNRKEKEKLRRMQMKSLHSKLASVIPTLTAKEKLPLPALLDVSVNYVKSLTQRVDELKAKKEQLEGVSTSATRGLVPPTVEVHDTGSNLEVNLVTNLNNTFMFIEALKILEEEGAQVVNASYAKTSTDSIIYSIHSQAFSSRIGIDTSRALERLKKLSVEGYKPTTI